MITSLPIPLITTYLISGNIVSDISDHFSQFCIASSRTKIFKNRKGQAQVKRDFSNFSDVKFNDELSALNLNAVAENSNNPTKSFSIFYNKLHKLINKHAPLKPFSKRAAKLTSKPWITKGIRKSIKSKNSIHFFIKVIQRSINIIETKY